MSAQTVRALIQAHINSEIQAGRITTIRQAKGAGPILSKAGVAPQPGLAYIARVERKPQENQLLGGHVAQDVREVYAVYLCAQSAADQTGGDAGDEIEAMAEELSTALLGWRPVADGDTLAYLGGKLVDAEGGGYGLWAEFYGLTKQIRS